MADVFISYSRKDKDFVRTLHQALSDRQRDTWVDWEDIPLTADWWEEIKAGIEASNTCVFVISPDSVTSTVCNQEIDHAVKHNKRLVPIVRREGFQIQEVHPILARRNWLFFRKDDDFESAFQALLTVIDTDFNHVREHTRLLVRAIEWDTHHRDACFLMRGSILQQAEQWLVESANQEPKATDLHRQYILASRNAETLSAQSTPPKQEPRLNKEQYRDRQILLNKVRNYWIKGVLETSLHHRALIELSLQERLDAVEQPWEKVWQSPNAGRKPLPPGTKVIDKFKELGAGRTLLILGEPGSGKTTTLLELARDLLGCAENDVSQPIPVIFNLSSWSHEKQKIADWLVQELHTKYQVAKQIGQEWVNNQQLLLMLDGLDEVSAECREACVQAINSFSQEYGQTEMVIASRIQDYQALSTRLKLQGAISLQPLTLEQIYQYLSLKGSALAAVSAMLKADTTLQELAKTPLMLSIMTLAYIGKSIEDLPKISSIEERRQYLFDAYIERMFKRRGSQQYSQDQARRWLIWLAQQMVKRSQTVFLIERLQPSWLQNQQQKWSYAIVCGLIVGLGCGLGGGVNIGLVFGVPFGLISGLILGMGSGLIGGLLLGFIIRQIEPVETMKWSWRTARQNFKLGLAIGLIFGSIFGLSSGLLTVLLSGIQTALIDGITHGILFGIGMGSIFILLRGLTGPGIATSTVPNQGIWQSVKNAAIFTLLGSLGLGLVAHVAELPLLFGAIAGLLFGIFGAGESCLQHFALRLVLYCNGYIPWNYAHFLDWATERIFLQKVGGGYIFIHRLLLEHFARMKLD